MKPYTRNPYIVGFVVRELVIFFVKLFQNLLDSFKNENQLAGATCDSLSIFLSIMLATNAD